MTIENSNHNNETLGRAWEEFKRVNAGRLETMRKAEHPVAGSLNENPCCAFCGGNLHYCRQGAEVCTLLGKSCMQCDNCSCLIEDKDALAHQHKAAQGDAVERVALAMLNRVRAENGEPTVATFDGFDDETIVFWTESAKAAIASMGSSYARQQHDNSEFNQSSGYPVTDEKGRPMTYWGGLAKESQREYSVMGGVQADAESLLQRAADKDDNLAPPHPVCSESSDAEEKIRERIYSEVHFGRGYSNITGKIMDIIRPYLRTTEPDDEAATVEQIEALTRLVKRVGGHPEPVSSEPVSLVKCAMALQGNQRIKLGSDLQAIAKVVLDAAKAQGAQFDYVD